MEPPSPDANNGRVRDHVVRLWDVLTSEHGSRGRGQHGPRGEQFSTGGQRLARQAACVLEVRRLHAHSRSAARVKLCSSAIATEWLSWRSSMAFTRVRREPWSRAHGPLPPRRRVRTCMRRRRRGGPRGVRRDIRPSVSGPARRRCATPPAGRRGVRTGVWENSFGRWQRRYGRTGALRITVMTVGLVVDHCH